MDTSELENTETDHIPFKKKLWDGRTDLLLGIILFLTAGLYALLMFRDRFPSEGLMILGGLWLVYLLLGGRLTYASPVDLPMLALFGLLLLSLYITVDLDYSLPKFYGLLLGFVLFYLIVNIVRNYQRLYLAILSLIILALGTAGLGLLTADWSKSTYSFAALFQNFVLSFLSLSARSGDLGGTNLNTIGGALAFFPSLFLSLIWDGGAFHRTYLHDKANSIQLNRAYKAALILTSILCLGMIFMTGSRGAYLGTAGGLFLVALWKDRRFLWLIPVLLVVFFAGMFIFANGNISEFVSILDTDEESSTLPNRIETWKNAIYIIEDFPLSGPGIFTFGKVFNEFYSFGSFSNQNQPLLHAHNLYLSVAYDLGIPGLVLYMALLSASGYMVFHALRIGRSILRSLLIGLSTGLLSHHIFGLMDANNLGTKLGAILWIFLGLIAAVYVHRKNFQWQQGFPPNQSDRTSFAKPTQITTKRRFTDMLIGLAYWLLISLGAVTFVNISPLVSLALAMAGGIYLGILLTKQYRKTTSKLKAYGS